MKFLNENVLVKIAQGDAYAFATEYIDQNKHSDFIKEVLRFDKYHKHPIRNELKAGQYSDDTQWSLAVAEIIIELESKNIRTIDFADRFVKSFIRDPRDAYSRGLQVILNSILENNSPYSGEDLIKKLIPNSTKNGAAMRSVPLGFLPSIEEVIRLTIMQAEITHKTEEGTWSAIAIALMSHFGIYNSEPFTEMFSIISEWHPVFKKYLLGNWVGRVKEYKDPLALKSFGIYRADSIGINTAHAVLTLLRTKKDLKEILEQIILWGGDTDSVAATAWGIASSRMPWPEEEPIFFESDLELGGNFGISYLKNIGSKLVEKYC